MVMHSVQHHLLHQENSKLLTALTHLIIVLLPYISLKTPQMSDIQFP